MGQTPEEKSYAEVCKEEREALRRACYEAHQDKVKAQKSYAEVCKEEREALRRACSEAHQDKVKARKEKESAHKEREKAREEKERARKERLKGRRKAYNEKHHKERVRASHYKQEYGLSIAEYNLMRAEREGCCKICGRRPKRRLYVDHDHTTGRVRGLLCNRCNHALGLLSDSPISVVNAFQYLLRSAMDQNPRASVNKT